MAAGALQSTKGVTVFIAWVCVATLPSFAVALRLGIDPPFERRDA